MRVDIGPRYRQTGAYLLEALIGILVFALGVLGIVGLQAASLRTTADTGLRAEAVFAANQLMGNMWADVQGGLAAKYQSAPAGTGYSSWAAQLHAAQGGAWIADPTVQFAAAGVPFPVCGTPPSVTQGVPTVSIYIQIFWRAQDPAQNSCGVLGASCYSTCGVIGQNAP